jgi:hypothetical protein
MVVIRLLLTCVLLAHTAEAASPTPPPSWPSGPFATTQTVLSNPALDQSDPHVVMTYPTGNQHGNQDRKFPLIAYAHGMAGGGFDILGYADLFNQIASFGTCSDLCCKSS